MTRIVSGETGCPEPELIDNAIAFDLRAADEARATRVRLLIFRNAAAFEAAQPTVARCLSAAKPGGEQVASLHLSPYVAYWAPRSAPVAGLLRAALESVGGGSSSADLSGRVES